MSIEGIEYSMHAAILRKREPGHDIMCYTIDVDGRGNGDPPLCGICCECELVYVVTRTITLFVSAKIGKDVAPVAASVADIVTAVHPTRPEDCDA